MTVKSKFILTISQAIEWSDLLLFLSSSILIFCSDENVPSMCFVSNQYLQYLDRISISIRISYFPMDFLIN